MDQKVEEHKEYYDKDDKAISTEDLSDVDEKTNDIFIKSEAEKRLVRKLNWLVLPIIFLIIFIQFCDKSALSVAAVMGMLEDTHLEGEQFNWLGSIFYLGYLIYQVPNNYFIQKFPIAKYLGTMLVLWGIVVACTALCQNFAQLMGLRFLLGLFEGCSYPCVYILLNTLYRRSEQSFCWGFVGIGTGMGTVLGVVIAYGVNYLDYAAGLRAWRWGYIVFGCFTVVIGIITFFFLVDDVHHKLLRLTEEEILIVEERARDNCVVRVHEIKTEQIWEALREPRLWLLTAANTLNCIQIGGLVTFSTLLVQGLGFSTFVSIILQVPNGVAGAVFSIGGVMIAARVRQNTFTAIGLAIFSLVGCVLLITLPGVSKLAGFYMTWSMNGTSALILTLVSNNVSGYTKRIFYNAMGMVALTLGNFIGPLMMSSNQAPQYTGALIGYSICNLVVSILLVFNYILMKKENTRRIENPATTPTDIYLDLTDKQDRNIMYKL
ncbi:unnamed protein product [Mucor hiemalis]